MAGRTAEAGTSKHPHVWCVIQRGAAECLGPYLAPLGRQLPHHLCLEPPQQDVLQRLGGRTACQGAIAAAAQPMAAWAKTSTAQLDMGAPDLWRVPAATAQAAGPDTASQRARHTEARRPATAAPFPQQVP